MPPLRGEHSPQPVRSFRSHFSWRSPSRQPHSSSTNNDTDTSSTSQYEPRRPMSPPQIQITGLAPAHVTPPPLSPRVFVTQPTFAEVPSSKSSPALSPPRRSLQGLATATRLSLKNQLSTSGRSRRSRPSTPQCKEEHHSTVPQSTKAYLAQSVNSVDPPSHPLHHVHHLTPPHTQMEQVPQPGTLLEPPSSNQRPSRSQPGGSGLFYQAHDFVINDSVFVDNSSDNFMESFLKETIPGAEFDSSDPNMPL